MNIGKHIILDNYNIPDYIFENLDTNYENFDNYIKNSLKKNNMNLISNLYNKFDNCVGAFTSLYLLSESHLSFHTWPEHNYIAVDCFTCGICNTDNIINDIIEYLKPENFTKQKIMRGNSL